MVETPGHDVNPLLASEIEDEGVDVLFLVWMAARSTSDLLDRVLAPTGLSGDDYAVFSMLRATGGMTPTQLSRWTAAPPTTVSAFVKRFEARGLVARLPNPEDGRSSLVRLTEHGRTVHAQARRRFTAVRERVVTGLAGHHAATRTSLLRLRTVVDELRADA